MDKQNQAFLAAFLLCMWDSSHHPYPLASHEHLHTDQEDKLLGFG